MPTIPFNPTTRAGANIQPQPVQFGGVQMPDFGTLAEGLFNVTRVVVAQEQANAGNRGLASAINVWKKTIPEIEKFKADHLGEPDFPTAYPAFLDETVRNSMEGLDFGSTREQEAFNLQMLRLGAGELQESIPASYKQFIANGVATVNQNLKDATARVGALSNDRSTGPSDLDQLWDNVATIFREAATDDPSAPGVMSTPQARSAFRSLVKDTALMRVMLQNKDNHTLFEMAHSEDPFVEVPLLGPDMQIVKTSEGVPVMVREGLGVEERDLLRKYATTRVSDRKNLLQNERAIQEAQLYEERQSSLREMLNAIHDGVGGNIAGRMTDMVSSTGLPLFEEATIRQYANYDRVYKDALASGRTTDRVRLFELQQRASDGDLTLASLAAEEDISASDLQAISGIIRGEAERRKQQDFGVFQDRKRQAREVLRRSFGVQGTFSSLRPDLANYLPGVLSQFDERIEAEWALAQQEQRPLTTVNPVRIANELIDERGIAFRNILVPDIQVAANLTFKYIQAASLFAENPDDPVTSLDAAFVGLQRDRDSGVIGPSEYSRQLFMLKAMRDRNMSLTEAVESAGIPIGKQIKGTPERPTDWQISEKWQWLLDSILGRSPRPKRGDE